jgi:hypothetical protein
MLIHDRRLKLTTSGYTNRKSKGQFTNALSDVLFERFLSFLNEVAEREHQTINGQRLLVGKSTPDLRSPPGKTTVARVDQRSAIRLKRLLQRRVVD